MDDPAMTPGPGPEVALVTGAARRIGAAIACALHREGMRVVVHCHRSRLAADELAARLEAARPGSAVVAQDDLTQSGATQRVVSRAVAAFGRLDVVVNNASSFYPTALGSVSAADFDDLVGTNLKAPLFIIQAATPHLAKVDGCVINIADINALDPPDSYGVYSAAKAGLIALTKSLARELGPGIRVNTVAPGPILPPEGSSKGGESDAPIAATVLGRWGSPEDVAAAVVFLVRDARFVTGQLLHVDGGCRS